MIGVIEKIDSFGQRTKFDICGRDYDSLIFQETELNSHARHCELHPPKRGVLPDSVTSLA